MLFSATGTANEVNEDPCNGRRGLHWTLPGQAIKLGMVAEAFRIDALTVVKGSAILPPKEKVKGALGAQRS
jgi:hypothetical protein